MEARTLVVGLILISIGIALYATWALWLYTRVDRPVDIPISMAMGHIKSPILKINRSAPYEIEIEVQKNIPFDTLNCLLGTAMAPRSTALQQCPDRPSVVNMSWALTSKGETIARGSSQDRRSGDWSNNSIARLLGTFQGQRGRSYELSVDVLADGSALSAGDPHLKVEVSSAVYEDDAVGSAILFFAMVALVVLGGVLVLASYIKARRARSVAEQ